MSNRDPMILPHPLPGDFKDVLPRSTSQDSAFVRIPVSMFPKLRGLGLGPLCAYSAILFECAVRKQANVKVAARTWKRFGCHPSNRYLHINALVKAGLICKDAAGAGKGDLFSLTQAMPSLAVLEPPPTKQRKHLQRDHGPSPVSI